VWACVKLKVDIISLSWGLRDRFNIISPVIERAITRGVVVLAATHNEGAREWISFPANMEKVLCIGAANGKGALADSTPVCGKGEKFSSLGVAVNGATIADRAQKRQAIPITETGVADFPSEEEPPITYHKTMTRTDGSSTATPIAAGIAALFLEYIQQFSTLDPLKRGECIRKLFLKMSGTPNENDEYQFLAPWRLLDARIKMDANWRWASIEAILNSAVGQHLLLHSDVQIPQQPLLDIFHKT
jgi:subtilisin family serine protease